MRKKDMKNPGLSITLVVLVVLTLAGCARPVQLSPAISREYNMSAFTRIDIGFTHDFLIIGNSFDIPIELEVIQAPTCSVSLTANENIFDYIDVSQSGDTLKIRINRNKIATNEATIKARIAMSELAGLKLESGILRANVFSSAERFLVEVGGASKLNIAMQAGLTEFKVSSSSDVIVSGSATDFRAEVSDSSTLKSDLQNTNVSYTISSSSDVQLKGEMQKLEAEVSGASTFDMAVKAARSDLKLSSSSDLTGDLIVSNLKIEVTGASQADITGSADNAELSAVSSSDLLLSEFIIMNAGIVLSGASEAELHVTDQLDVDLSSSSDLVYVGDPSLKDIRVSGDSRIDHR